MVEKKAYTVVIGGFILYLIIAIAIFLPLYLRNKRENLYILSGPFIKIKYENGKWSNMKNDDFTLKEFNVYESGKYKGQYKVMYVNKYYLYDEKGVSQNYDGVLFAYTGSLNTTFFPVNITTPTESDYSSIDKALTKLGISYNKELNLFQKVTIQEQDGQKNIYCINNYYVENTPNKVFSIVFSEKNGEVKIIKDHIISKDAIYDEPSYEINQVLDIKEDREFEIILEQTYYSRPSDSCVLLLNVDKKKSLIANLCE